MSAPTPLERDVNATIKLVLSEVEIAARMLPVDACEPYACEERRKRVIRAIWNLYKRCTAEVSDGDAVAIE